MARQLAAQRGRRALAQAQRQRGPSSRCYHDRRELSLLKGGRSFAAAKTGPLMGQPKAMMTEAIRYA
eukprot:9470898-Pyramimonas_sp.AAC.1